MKLFAFAMLSLVPSVTVCSVFSKEVDIYSGTYGNDDVEVFQPEEVTYHLAGRDGVFYEGAFTFDNYNPDKGGAGNRQGVFSGYSTHFSSTEGTSLGFHCTGLNPGKNSSASKSFIFVMGPWESGEEFVAPQVTFQNLGDLSFIADNMDMIGITDGATAGTGGGRYGKADIVSFNNVGNIEFRGLNHGGIGFSRLNSLAFTNTGDISFTDMKMGYSSNGGAIFINQGGDSSLYSNPGDGNISFDHTGNIIFRNLVKTSYYMSSAGIFTNEGSISFNDTENILFENNTSTGGPAAIGIGSIFLPDNQPSLSFSNIRGDIIFRNNKASGGSMPGMAGAITIYGSFKLVQTGDVLFENNVTDKNTAGAIYCGNNEGKRFGGQWLLSADGGNIVFRGNLVKGSSGVFARALGIFAYAPENDYTGISQPNGNLTMDFRAQAGREIVFYDGIDIESITVAMPTLHINRIPADWADYGGIPVEFGGTVRFSGALTESFLVRNDGESDGDYAERVETSRRVKLESNIIVEGGRLVLEYGMNLANESGDVWQGSSRVEQDKPVFNLAGGVLEMTSGSSISAQQVIVSGHGSGAILRVGAAPIGSDSWEGKTYELPSLSAVTIDMSHGFDWDLMPFSERGDSGINITASGEFLLGGTIGIADTLDDYASAAWGRDREFVIFNMDSSSKRPQGELKGVISNTTQSSTVDSPYTYGGTWEYEWRDMDGDGEDDQLLAIWKHEAGCRPDQVRPEQAGKLALNSLWSSASNAASLGNTALAQLTPVRLYQRYARNVWGMGLGDFARQRSRGGVDGYDYDGGGYSVGVDSDFGGKSGIWGIAFGQMHGFSRSRDFNGRITQDSLMGSIYWGRIFRSGERSLWTVKADLTWGMTDNCMKSRFSNGMDAHGEWNNRTWLVQAEVSRSIQYAGGWTVSPFLRMEFTHGTEASFLEDGSYARKFEGAVLRRLSIPAGVSGERSCDWKGRHWSQVLCLSYVGDAIQDVPEASVYSIYSDIFWRTRGVQPARHAVRVEYDAALQWNDLWTVYAGYGMEARGSSVYHRVNAGVSRAF